MSSQSFSSATRSFTNGAIAAISSRNASMPRLLDLVESALGDEEAALPVVAAVDHDEDPALIEPAERLIGIGRRPGDPHPEHVDRRADVLDRQLGPIPDRRVPPVRAEGQLGADLERTVGRSFARTPTTRPSSRAGR